MKSPQAGEIFISNNTGVKYKCMGNDGDIFYAANSETGDVYQFDYDTFAKLFQKHSGVLNQIRDYYMDTTGIPTGQERTVIENGFKKTQIQKVYRKDYSGTVVKAMRWETVKEVQV